jgi:hypothetical protein
MSSAFVIFASDSLWRIASPGATDEVRARPEDAPAQTAAAVAAALRARGYQGEGVLLALPSAWCLSAAVPLDGVDRHDRAALSFRLEEKLPLAAESFTADFVLPATAASDDPALGVCVANDRVRPIVDALEAAGVVVRSASPAAMLAVQALGPARSGVRLVLWGEGGGRTNVVSLRAGTPSAWSFSADGGLAMELDVALVELAGDVAQAVACDLPPGLVALAHDRGVADVRADPTTLEQAVTRAAPHVLSGSVTPWVELRRGQLGFDDRLRVVRRSINAALLAAAALLLVAAGVFAWRAAAYDALAQAAEREAADAFRAEFPNWSVPANVAATVESERTKLARAGTSALPPEAQESALRVLHGVLSRVPADAKIALAAMNFYDRTLELSGRARGHQDVDVLVAAARAAGLEVPPPEMRKEPDGLWGFVVRGAKPQPAPKPAPVAAGGGR